MAVLSRDRLIGTGYYLHRPNPSHLFVLREQSMLSKGSRSIEFGFDFVITNADIYLRMHVVRMHACGTESKQLPIIDLETSSFIHKSSLLSPPLHPNRSTFQPIRRSTQKKDSHLTPTITTPHHTTTMPDQVKYANKLQGKNILVIGGSSGSHSSLSHPFSSASH
jgi:hypothetical protein